MPMELPGFYFDIEKNRYFPLSSRPTPKRRDLESGSKEITQTSQVPEPSGMKRRKLPLYSASVALPTTTCYHRRVSMQHDILCSHIACTSRLEQYRASIYGSNISALCFGTNNGEPHRHIGDDRGWVYTCSGTDASEVKADCNLSPASEISSLCISGRVCLAACSGPAPRVALWEMNIPGKTVLLTLDNVHDIWATQLRGNSFVLGVDKRAMCVSDLETFPMRKLETHSDVFAVEKTDHLVYTGSRNGSITRFDMRIGKPLGQKLFEERFDSDPRSSVVHLKLIHESQLLVSQMNGNLCTYDTRFVRPARPIITFPGHMNCLTQKLGIAVDPAQDFLFAAGEDSHIRGWSLRTGDPLLASTPISPDGPEPRALEEPMQIDFDCDWIYGDSDPARNPFQAVFPHAVSAMQVTDEAEGMCLWVGAQKTLYRYYLGQRGV